MKRATALLCPLVLLLSAFFALPAKAIAQQSAIVAAALSPAQNAETRNWKRYRYDADGFSIEFPAEPSSKPNDDNTGTRHFVAIQNGNVAYFAEVAQLPADLNKETQKIFEDYAKGSAKGTNSEIKSQKTISLQGLPGTEFVLENETMILHFRLYLQGKKLYQVLVAATKDLMPGAETDRFLNSFDLAK